MMKLYKIALRNISRNRRRSLLSGIAIAIAGAAIVFMFGFFEGMTNDMKSNLWTYMTGAVRVRNAEFDKYERLNPMHLALPDFEALLTTIENDPAVIAVSPRINFPGRVPIGGIGSDEKINVMGMGVDFRRESSYQDYQSTLMEGRLPESGKTEALIGRALAERLGTGLGDKFTVLSQSGSRGSNAFTLTVTGIMDYPIGGLGRTLVQMPLDMVQKYLWLPNQVQEVLIKVDEDVDDPATVARRLATVLKSSVPLSVTEYRQVNGMASYMDMASRIYDLIGIIFFILASTVIINTTIMVIFERMKEIGTLGAMGMTGRQLVRLFFLESLFISVIGAFTGIVVGIGITAYFGSVGFGAMAKALDGMDNMGISSVIYPVLNFRSTVMVFVYSIAVSAVATWWPSRRAARITPVEALRHV